MIKVAVTELEYRKAAKVFAAAGKSGVECVSAPASENELADFIRKNGCGHAIVGVEQ